MYKCIRDTFSNDRYFKASEELYTREQLGPNPCEKTFMNIGTGEFVENEKPVKKTRGGFEVEEKPKKEPDGDLL